MVTLQDPAFKAFTLFPETLQYFEEDDATETEVVDPGAIVTFKYDAIL